jgi:lipoprotein-releasing system permease protein
MARAYAGTPGRAAVQVEPEPEPRPAPVTEPERIVPRHGPAIRPFVGDVTPPGGYRSQLPDDDYVPDSIDPDPCKSADRVKEMPGIVLGRSLAKQLDVDLGDCVQVTSPQIGLSYGAGSRSPIAKQFRVSAVFEAGFDQYDSKLVYTDLYEAQAFYEYGDSVTGVEMKVDHIDHAPAIAKRIDLALNNGIYYTMDWRQLNHGLFTALFLQQIWMSLVLGLIILVAACSVIATIIMVVLEKKKEIALLKALGARRTAVLLIFLYQGGLIGVAGASLGVLFGGVSCWLLTLYRFPLDPKVYFISRLPIAVTPLQFVFPAALAIVICLVATILPAAYAAGMRPADGMRNE